MRSATRKELEQLAGGDATPEVRIKAAERLEWIRRCEGRLGDSKAIPAEIRSSLSVGMIDAKAREHYRARWFPVQDPTVGFVWDEFTLIPYYQDMDDRFEAAIWLGGDLVGMGVGEADLDVGYVARDFIERAPTAAGDSVRGLMVPIMNLCLEEWAGVKNVGYVCVFDPNLQSVRRLGDFGFEYINALEVLGNGVGPAFYSYCEKRLGEFTAPLPFVYSPVDLEELGEANDPFSRFGAGGHIPAETTRRAKVLAAARGLC